MCGICGFTCPKSSSLNAEGILLHMLAAICYRGPDDQGVFIEEGMALGARRLSVIDISGGHQPVHNEDKSLWITYNGEIYNFPALKEALIKNGHSFYTESDTEVIVHLYEEYGYECLNKLNGMFAFAIWDKNKNELFLARDRFGIKPLYYAEFGGRLIFASELKAILRFPDFKREIDLVALDQYLTFEYVPAPRSLFKNIFKLPAGNFLSYRNSNLSIRKYWDINPVVCQSPVKEAEIEERLLGILTDTIGRHLRSDVPLGIFLSGGIDSSTITALVNKVSGNRVKTFSIGFEESSFDESRYIHQVAKACGTEHEHRIFDDTDLLGLIPETARFLDEPLADASFFPAYLLSKFAKQKVTVALSGDGGDELFAGYPTYQAHTLAAYYQAIPAIFRKNIIEKSASRLPVSMDNFSFDFKVKKFLSAIDQSLEIRHVYWMGAFNFREKGALYEPALQRVLNKEHVLDTIAMYLTGYSTAEAIQKLQYFDLKTYLQDALLVKTDRASMLNSLEVRVPYLDHELVEFVFSLPPRLRLHNLESKYIFKKAVKGLLPGNIIHREKKGFGIPVAFWVKKELKNLILDVLGKDKIKREGLFSYQYIESLLKSHFDNKADNRKKIWTLFMFELWMQEYFR
jgi:asparagine synthase (glutamine-hydrolysing)